uniref:Uncharacterized protein n=1 Tax=Steinernema glaseri TaxID=37863 RepID=A0A1I7ZT33_9BILA
MASGPLFTDDVDSIPMEMEKLHGQLRSLATLEELFKKWTQTIRDISKHDGNEAVDRVLPEEIGRPLARSTVLTLGTIAVLALGFVSPRLLSMINA